MIPTSVLPLLAPVGAFVVDVVHPSVPKGRPGLRVVEGEVHMGLAFRARLASAGPDAPHAPIGLTVRDAVLAMLDGETARRRQHAAHVSQRAAMRPETTLGRTMADAAERGRGAASQIQTARDMVALAWTSPMPSILPPDLVRILSGWNGARTLAVTACGMALSPAEPRILATQGRCETEIVWEARTAEDVGLGHSPPLAVVAMLEALACRLRTNRKNSERVMRDVPSNPSALRTAASLSMLRERVDRIAREHVTTF